jgi:VWFA-related protein
MKKTILCVFAALTLLAQQPAEVPVFHAEANLVILNVFVHDRNGKPLEGLTKNDFTVLEDGKPQMISVFDFQRIAAPPSQPGQGGSLRLVEERPAARATVPAPPQPEPGGKRFRDRRLLVLFFDLSALKAEDQVHAFEAAEKFIKEQMTPADLVSIMSFSSTLRVNQEFTSDRDQLIATLKKFHVGEASELADMANTDVDDSDTAAFALDETEFNIFNTDQKLSALESAARSLSALPEKKALVYFSSGVGRTGTDNESQLRATINAAVRSNVSFYPIDVRGLAAFPPGGDATQAAASGNSLFSGAAQNRQRDQFNSQQETLDTLASDTGGKALLDSNDLTTGIRQAQDDITSYYILGYYSSNGAKDGRFRNVSVKFAHQIDAKLDYRSGYYGEKEFKHFSSEEKDKQLEDALLLGDPVTDLPLALEVDWFRLSPNRFFVPVSVKIPASVIPLKKNGGAETTQFDFVGEVRDNKNARISMVRDAIRIRLPEANAKGLDRKSLIYDTGFTLGPGEYRVKLLARENLTGQMGTFEMHFTIPSAPPSPTAPLVSTLVLGNQREPVKEAVGTAGKQTERQLQKHPLVHDNEKLIPNVTRVFRRDQNLYVYLEVYDPAAAQPTGKPAVAATVSFLQGRHMVFQTSAVQETEFLEGRPRTVAVQLQVPLKQLPPGEYIAQVNLVDQPGRKFAFPRARFAILPDLPVRAASPGTH